MVEDDFDLLKRLMTEGYNASPQQAIIFVIEVWDTNCHQHIPQKIDAAEVAPALAHLEQRIAALGAENAQLRASLGQPPADPKGQR